ncbi:MAG: LolA-related protein [Thiohalophilus sp.]|uniref:LolA-related protein n=1 Tax=Thiohalophilus sp. TaxID=3028392 RepID=UPI002870165E|nr:LolA-related protein [Thiohalophilus sp.]MDR9435517.1 LolA-related protein [Thiohalophilus sp.]
MSRLWIFIVGVVFSSLVHADFLDQRLSSIAANSELTAPFTEIWRADYLDEDVVNHGSLHFKPPNILVKEIISPDSLIYTVSGDSVKIQQGEKIQHIKLSSSPELAMGINTMRMLLRGDRDGLEEMFLIQLRYSDKNFQSWAIELFPRSTYKKVKIKKITVIGNEDDLREIEVDYVDNSVHITRISPNE